MKVEIDLGVPSEGMAPNEEQESGEPQQSAVQY